MDNYRMTVSRDRLAEFRRTSANISAANNNGTYQKLHQQQPSYYNDGHHGTAYHPPVQPQSSYINRLCDGRYDNNNGYESFLSTTENNSNDSSLASTEAFFVKIEDIKWLVGKINENITEIESLHTSSLSSINEEKSFQVNHNLEDLVCQTSKLNKEAKDRIKETEISNAKLPLNTSDRQMRKTQLQALKKKFIETIQRYQDIERTFEKRQRQRIERQILIVKPEATPHEIELAIDSEEAPQIFAHSLLNSSRTGNASQVLDEVQTRHRNIKKIEKTILELHQLFLDMQSMVELQEETLTSIEKSSENAVYELEKGNKHITVAVQTAKMTRKRKWCCFIIFIILLVVAGILIWWFAFPKSHN